jgi:anti-sigma B factor antagonist
MHSGVAVIEFEGPITLGEGSALLRERVMKAVAEGHKGILLDLEGVSYIDSGGLGELVSCNAVADARGADVKLLHLQKRVHGLLQITKLITVFETFEDEEQAIRSFSRSRAAEA